MASGPRVLLHLEGALVLALAVLAYAWLAQPWWRFAALALAPDLAMLAYLAGPRAGAIAYDAAHTYLAPAALALLSNWLGWPAGVGAALVWCAHVGADRALGFGLKYGTSFQDTHLQRA